MLSGLEVLRRLDRPPHTAISAEGLEAGGLCAFEVDQQFGLESVWTRALDLYFLEMSLSRPLLL